MLSFLCYNSVPCDLWRNKLFCCASAICLRLRGRMCGNLDQILGTRIRQSLRVILLSVDKCPDLGCPSLEVPTSLCTAQAASRKGRAVAFCPMSCSLSLAPDMCSHVLVVLQAGCEMNQWPCLLGESQSHPHHSPAAGAPSRRGWWVPRAASRVTNTTATSLTSQRCFKAFQLSQTPLQWEKWSGRSLVSFAEHVTGVARGAGGFWWLCEQMSEPRLEPEPGS